jgi:hypothetical protein
MQNLNIFIPTKGRFDKCKTANLIGNYEKLFLIVEPQDYENYLKNYGDYNIIQLPFNNKGLSYARNFVRDYCYTNGIKDFWLLDDDISYFYERTGTKLERISFETALSNSRDFFIENEVAVGSLEYRQYAWSSKKRMVENSFCDSAVFINNELTQGIRYNEELKLKIDRDFCIKVIKSGAKTARDTFYAFSVPPNGSNKGGLKEVAYDVGNTELNMCLKMVEIHGSEICTHIVKPDGRNDLKIHWKKINI